MSIQPNFQNLPPCAGSGVLRIDPLHFLAGCRKRRLNQVLSVLSVRIGFCVYCLLGPLLDCASLCSVFWLLLVKLSVLAKWLARKTPLTMHLCGKEIISTKSRPKSAYDFWFSILCNCLVLGCTRYISCSSGMMLEVLLNKLVSEH